MTKKKQKKNTGKKKGGKGKGAIKGTQPSTDADPGSSPSTSTVLPRSATCFICLDEDDPNSDDRLMRDCSCRGDDAGFAHHSCRVRYAADKSETLYEAGRRDDSGEPWSVCPNCHQDYQGHVAIKMAKSLLVHMEGEHDPGGYNKLLPLGNIVRAVIFMSRNLTRLDMNAVEEGRRAAEEMISIAGDRSHPLHLYGKTMDAYMCLSLVEELKGTPSGFENAIKHIERVRDYCADVRENEGLTSMEFKLKSLRRNLSGTDDDDDYDDISAEDIFNLRAQYQNCVESFGKDATVTLCAGAYLGHYLLRKLKFIEAQRLLTELAHISRRVHGPDHSTTVQIEEHLEAARQRQLAICTGHGESDFEALSFDEGSNRYIVKGPILDPRREDEEETFPIAPDKILFLVGTPVICVGLKNAAHLNGELGYIREYRGNTRPVSSFEVHFERTGLKPVIVKSANLRIAFDV